LNGVESYLREQVALLILYLPPENLGQSHAVPDLVIGPGWRVGTARRRRCLHHLQAMDLLALDHVRQHAGGLSVTSLRAFGCVDSADPHAYLGAIGFHGEGVSVRHG
jgi:hypothetical protein